MRRAQIRRSPIRKITPGRQRERCRGAAAPLTKGEFFHSHLDAAFKLGNRAAQSTQGLTSEPSSRRTVVQSALLGLSFNGYFLAISSLMSMPRPG